jgi:hypothetical protein
VGLRQDKDTNLLALVAQDDVWLVGVLSGVEDISIQDLSLEELVLGDDLVLNACIGETFGKSLDHALLKGVKASLGFLIPKLFVEVNSFNGRDETILGQL